MTTALTFQTTHFDVVEKHNQLWLTAAQIGKALGYAREDSVSRIYDRNQDEFSNAMTETVKLTVSGNYQKTVRIFSLRGAHLIAMFARTALAKQFRKWVLDILDKETQHTTIEPITSSRTVAITPRAQYPLTYNTDWQPASVALSPRKQAHFIRFHLQPKAFKSEFEAKFTPQLYMATFEFADANGNALQVRGGNLPLVGDFGYFESKSLEDLWLQVTAFSARCNSRCLYF